MIYKVTYSSPSAHYGPSYIEASSAEEAKRLFGKGAFSPGERAYCMKAVPVSETEMARALRGQNEN